MFCRRHLLSVTQTNDKVPSLMFKPTVELLFGARFLCFFGSSILPVVLPLAVSHQEAGGDPLNHSGVIQLLFFSFFFFSIFLPAFVHMSVLS